MTPLETFEAALERIDYDAFRAEQAAARAEGRYLGIGTSSYVEPTASGMPFSGTEGATIRIEPTGAVNVYLAGGSAGNSLETTAVQLTADALGVDIAQVRTIQGDTAVTPFGAGTGGSRSGSMIAGAIRETAAVLRERIAAIAAHKLEASPDDIVLADGRASVRGSPGSGLTIAEIADLAYFGSHQLPPDIPMGLEATARYRAESFVVWANATHVCTCEVDIATGRGDAAALRRRRGLRADDQPERRRGADRRRHRAGHRRRAARGLLVGRRRQPADHDLRRLPAADQHGGAADRVRPHRGLAGPGARRVQGRR